MREENKNPSLSSHRKPVIKKILFNSESNNLHL